MKSKLRKTGLFRTSCLSALTPTLLRHHFHHHRHKPHTLHTFGGVETQAKEEAFKIAAHSSARRSSQRSTHLDASESELELTGPAVRTFRIRQFSPATEAEEDQDSCCSRAKSIRQRAPSGCMNSSKTCILPTRTQGLTPTHLAFDDKDFLTSNCQRTFPSVTGLASSASSTPRSTRLFHQQSNPNQ